MQKKPLKAIVIGAGIAGCSSAYALAKRGIAVSLIERHETVAQEASGNPVAMLYPKFNTGMNPLSKLAAEGFSFTLALLKQLPCNAGISDICGQIQLAYNQQEQEKQAKLINAGKQHVHLQTLTATEASEKAQLTLKYGGIYLPESGWVKPKAFCEALIESDLITKIVSTKAVNIKKLGSQWQVLLDEGQPLEADIIVICNANDITQFTQCNTVSITPVRGQVNFFGANDISEKIKPIICSDHYLSPAVDGVHSIGTSYAPNDLNPNLSNHDTQTNLHALKKISPAIFDRIDQHNISGRVAWRSATRDYFPLAGQLIDEEALRKSPPRYNADPRDLPWLAGLYVNAGHGSKGMITAPICGELIANHIDNLPFIMDNVLAAKLNPSRFLLRDMGLKQIAQNCYQF